MKLFVKRELLSRVSSLAASPFAPPPLLNHFNPFLKIFVAFSLPAKRTCVKSFSRRQDGLGVLISAETVVGEILA